MVVKRPATEAGPNGGLEPEVRQVAEFYGGRENYTREEREQSAIIHLKKLNNWVKTVLLQKYVTPGAFVFDLACGKGGDLQKWEKANIGFYCGVDVAQGSVEHARSRYCGETSTVHPNRHLRFPAAFFFGDCWGVDLAAHLKHLGPFDVCSCQFALHYSFETEARARQALRNVAGVLRQGGVFLGTIPDANVIIKKLRQNPGSLEFGNAAYSLRFDEDLAAQKFPAERPFGIKYHFHLEDAVDLPEYLVHFPTLQKIAEENGLQLEMKANFHAFVHDHYSTPVFADLMRRIIGPTYHETMTMDEWDAAYLYLAFVFRKIGGRGGDPPRRPPPFAAGPIQPDQVKELV